MHCNVKCPYSLAAKTQLFPHLNTLLAEQLPRQDFVVDLVHIRIYFQAKCQGKEHMIESEIAILSAIAHSNIIQLEEVFDFPTEKYLVMEYVSGGDLFDAIAHDIKYTENVARDMIKDLANALQVHKK